MKISVEIQRYAWGILRVVRVGTHFSIVIHPEAAVKLRRLADGASLRFTDEQEIAWVAWRQEDDIHFAAQHRLAIVPLRELAL
jgi:hypothetical protein